ncbi:MAG TPA: sulfotransferase [Rhizomicrobium sp.]|jgi:tetratricopeptide (TPR) repeat protein
MNVAAFPPEHARKAIISRAIAHLRSHELADAGSLLGHALETAPNDPAFLHLFGTVRRLEHRPVEAEELYRRSLANQNRQPHVHRDLGKLLASLGRIDEAICEFQEALCSNPNDDDAHLCLATGLARQGEASRAEASYRNALRLKPEHIVARLGLAETLCKLRRAREAELSLLSAPPVREPAIAAMLTYRLGLALAQQAKFLQALTLFDRAQAQMPDIPGVEFSRGEIFQQMGLWEKAAPCFRKVLARQPNHSNAAACLALISALTGDFAEARELALHTLARDKTQPIAHIAMAIVEIEAAEIGSAVERLRELFEGPASLKSEGVAVAAGFASDAFDRHGRYAEAFAVARASKIMLRELWLEQECGKRVTDSAREQTNYFQKSSIWTAGRHQEFASAAPTEHVFVLGFLRSGTTLLETILATDPDVVHVDEIDFLGAAADAFLADMDGLDRLSQLPENEVALWRENYWKAVREAGFSAEQKIFVDKMPINSLRLPLIARLFPTAKIVFAIRDPRDVVLSCFRRHFDPTPYSREFLDLEDCARLYAATMSLADACRQKLPLQILELRYEDLIGNFTDTVHSLCRFIGVAWSGSKDDFQQAAGSIDLRSASARQVRRGLYGGAVGHWRHYRQDLAPVLPILAPWATRFGYPVE